MLPSVLEVLPFKKTAGTQHQKIQSSWPNYMTIAPCKESNGFLDHSPLGILQIVVLSIIAACDLVQPFFVGQIPVDRRAQ